MQMVMWVGPSSLAECIQVAWEWSGDSLGMEWGQSRTGLVEAQLIVAAGRGASQSTEL